MRRILGVILVASLCLNLTTASARDQAGKKKKKVERVEEKPYVGGFGVGGVGQSACIADGVACARFPIEKGERFVALEISDATGQPIYASVYIYGYTDGTDSHEHICAESDRPFALGPGVEELVVVPSPSAGTGTPACTGVTTQGNVTVTFSNLP